MTSSVQVSDYFSAKNKPNFLYFAFTFFVGPKRDEQLMAVSEKLTDIVDYDFIGIPLGFLARPMVFLLNLFHGFTASWGLAIVFLTLTVKGILFPVTYKSVVSMRKMQLIKPELDKIKERWPNDREKQQMEQLKQQIDQANALNNQRLEQAIDQAQ